MKFTGKQSVPRSNEITNRNGQEETDNSIQHRETFANIMARDGVKMTSVGIDAATPSRDDEDSIPMSKDDYVNMNNFYIQ